MPVSVSRMLAAGTTSLVALAAAAGAPALARQTGYQQPTIDYAQPQTDSAARAAVQQAEPVFVSQPVVQPLPADRSGAAMESGAGVEAAAQDAAAAAEEAAAGASWTDGDGHSHRLPPGHPVHPGAGMAYPVQVYPGMAAPQVIYSYPPVYQAAYPQPVQPVDRASWIADCRAYFDQHRQRGERGGTTGAVVGAIAGGVIGNRVADGERLGGTLIGAGVGGLAGLFIDQAIGRERKAGRKKDCDSWYDDYLSSSSRGQFWSGGYMVVPQTTVVIYQSAPMVPVVREVVREEWVEEEVTSYRKVTPPAPTAPKTRYIKRKAVTKPVKGG